MLPQAPPSGGEQLTVTSTAATVLALTQTASGEAGFTFKPGVNYILLHAEDGDIRYAMGYTPTTSIGLVLSQGSTVALFVAPDMVELIRDGGSNVKVNAIFGRTRTQD